MKGIFITFEGIDGAGKSTHILDLARSFEKEGRVVVLTREPGGTLVAEKIRDILLENTIDALTESLLVFAARRDHIQTVIKPALKRGEVVLSDRFSDATFAYQGFARGFAWDKLEQLENWVQEGLVPDLTYWFDLSPTLAANRLLGIRQLDRFESQSQAFFEAVREGYSKRMHESPERFAKIDANQTKEQVFSCMLKVAQKRGYLV